VMMVIVNELQVGIPTILAIRCGSERVCYSQGGSSVWNGIQQLAI